MLNNYACIKTVAFIGMDAVEVKVEVHIGCGLPFFSIVGLPDKNITESKERIRASFKNIGLEFPAKRITVNMSPSNLPKEGSHYDFPIALGILTALGVVEKNTIDNWLVLGEISLDGKLNDVKGILIASLFSIQHAYKLVCPLESKKEVVISGNSSALLFDNLLNILSYHKGLGYFNISESFFVNEKLQENEFLDFDDIIGQEYCKRAMQIAAVFRMHMLLIGSPGIGKSMLAQRMKNIMPDLTVKEKLEISKIYSISSKINEKYNYDIPYRNPHHSCSSAALIGGGIKSTPGEVSLAHNGILFLDELAEFAKSIEGLRECLETKEVVISRANYHIKYPADCQVIAAMNPCKCGYLGTIKQCRKAPDCSKEYTKKISGPLLERFDFIIYMDNDLDYDKKNTFKSSQEIKSTVEFARKLYSEIYGISINDLKLEDVFMDENAHKFLIEYSKKNLISKRRYFKIIKISLAISLLERLNHVEKKHVLEAIMYSKTNI